MANKVDFTPYMNDIQKGGALIEKIQQGTATEEERIKVKELIWTVTCKILMKDILANLPMQQKDLAKEINVRPTMISAYKKGKALPSMPTLLMMLSILKPELIYTITDGKIAEVNETFKLLGVDLIL